MEKDELKKAHNGNKDMWRTNGLRLAAGAKMSYTELATAHKTPNSTVITVDVQLNHDEFDKKCFFTSDVV